MIIFNILVKVILLFLPWKLRRLCLVSFFNYDIHPSAHIGFAWIYPKMLFMNEDSRIAHLNIAIHLDYISLGTRSSIGRGNWITGFPTRTHSKHFSHDVQRKSELIIGHDSAITKKHHIDCTNYIHIGDFVTIAGYNSQFLTHSIDVYENRQDSHPIEIGDYCFVSTGVIVLGGSKLPSHSVLSAGAVLNKKYMEDWSLYGGVPAVKIKDIPQTAKYFSRNIGFVY